MSLRKGHGRGKGQPRVEVLPPDELPSASPALTVRSGRGADGRFTAGNTVARARKLRPGTMGGLGLEKSSPEFRLFLAWGRRYSAHRRAELAQAHGGEISAGVGAMVESAGLAMAASRFLHSKGAETGDAELLKKASTLANDARQNELAAWELAAREAKARPSNPLKDFWEAPLPPDEDEQAEPDSAPKESEPR